MISGYRREVGEMCALLGHYAPYNGNSLPWISWPLKMRPIGCPETSVWNYHYTPSHTAQEGRQHKYLSQVSGELQRTQQSVVAFPTNDLGKSKGTLRQRLSRRNCNYMPSERRWHAVSPVV